jgi:hypothetical protein
MKRLRKYSERVATKLDELCLSVASLVDVCFLLMVYFMVTTTIVSGGEGCFDRDSRAGSEVDAGALGVSDAARAEDGADCVEPGEARDCHLDESE